MTTAQELKERFHQCMPLFIALGDEMRLSIIEVLTAEAMDRKQQAGQLPAVFYFSPFGPGTPHCATTAFLFNICSERRF